MAWARLDDGFHDHPKVDELSLAAVGLWTLSLTWAHRHRRTAVMQGHVTEARVRKIAGKNAESLAAELVAARLWDVEPNLGGWEIHDFGDYLPRERDIEERKEAGRKGAAKRWQRDSKPDGNLPSDSMASDGSCASAPASPSRPVPTQPENTKSIRSAKPSTPDRFLEFYAAFPKHVAKQAAKRRWDALIARGVDPQEIIDGAVRYAAEVRGIEPKFVKQPDGWLNAGRWEDEPPAPKASTNGGWWEN